MRLAIVSPYPPEISGIGQYGMRMSNALAHSRHFDEVLVVANRAPGAPEKERLGALNVHRVWDRDHEAARAVMAAVRRWRPDVVWFNIGLTTFGKSRLHNFFGMALPMLARAANFPAVVTLHEILEASDLRALGAVNGHITHWGGRAATRLLLQADTVCVTLQSYERLVRQHYGARNVVHLPHGAFDDPRFTPLSGEKRILIFGTFGPYKGLPELIDIFRRLRQADSTVALTVAGSDHPRFPGYLNRIRAGANGLPGLDWQMNLPEDEIPAAFARACVVALPSTATTGASSVVHRAASHGRPVVAFDLPDLRAVSAEENLHIEFVPLGDADEFAARLRNMLDDPAQCEAIGRANVAAMQTMTLDATCRRYVQLFDDALARRK